MASALSADGFRRLNRLSVADALDVLHRLVGLLPKVARLATPSRARSAHSSPGVEWGCCSRRASRRSVLSGRGVSSMALGEGRSTLEVVRIDECIGIGAVT